MTGSEPPLRLSDLDLWAIHVNRCTAVIRRALDLLAEDAPASPLDEPTLNRQFYWKVLTAEREFAARGEAPFAPVIPEAHNAPAAADTERATREKKIPDFQWGLRDDSVPDVRESAKHFVVEAKCLIRPRRRDWVYTEQYVVAGTCRFVAVEHGYGMGVGNGAMVGYVRALSFEEAESEVGSHLAAHSLPPLSEDARDGQNYIEFTHRLKRPFGESPFLLAHLWRRI